jgi:hypothetical protein
MTEGEWIAMPGVLLITTGNPEAAAREEGIGTDAPGDGARAAEGTTGPTSDEAFVDRTAGPSGEVKRTEAAVGTVSPAPASPGATAVSEVDAASVLVEVALATVNTEEMAHAAELEAALLVASSPRHEGPPEPAAAEPAEAPVAAAEAEV